MRQAMKIDDVRQTAYSMPLTNPSFPRGPYCFFNREYFIITYRTDPEVSALHFKADLTLGLGDVRVDYLVK
jgi:acetoacetate decarboxylase